MNTSSTVDIQPPRVKKQTVLDCAAFWTVHNAEVVYAEKTIELPFFYPIYSWNNHFSYSPFPLMQLKKSIKLKPELANHLALVHNDVSSPDEFAVEGIERVGEPPVFSRTIVDRSLFAEKLAAAMQADIAHVERENPDKTNYILCGGKDSLNLLLFKWSNPTVVLSAEPNLPLVKDFVSANKLGLDVVEICDLPPSNSGIDREIVEAAMMVDLENWKWTEHLKNFADAADGKAVFWKGQFADAFLTDYFRSYTHKRSKSVQFRKKVIKRLCRAVSPTIAAPLDTLTMRHFAEAAWQRGAVAQGAHLGFLRSITGCLFVSAYHGKQASKIWLAGDFPRISGTDLRPEVGAHALGRTVWYPNDNPSPPASEFRKGLRTIEHFLRASQSFGLKVTEQ